MGFAVEKWPNCGVRCGREALSEAGEIDANLGEPIDRLAIRKRLRVAARPDHAAAVRKGFNRTTFAAGSPGFFGKRARISQLAAARLDVGDQRAHEEVSGS